MLRERARIGRIEVPRFSPDEHGARATAYPRAEQDTSQVATRRCVPRKANIGASPCATESKTDLKPRNSDD
jgi:hypothetical protein